MALSAVRTLKELMEAAREAERAQDPERAASFYEKAIKSDPGKETAYNRLMIIYRKLKQYQDELRIINAGIRKFEHTEESRTKLTRKNRTIVQASEALAKSLGLKDKKGNELFQNEPIRSWSKRKETVEKKLANPAQKKKKNKSG